MLGLVLEGGGAKGAFQMGAWEAFRELGMEFDAVTGTSVGALNGALFVQGDYEQAYDMWYNLRPEHVIHGDPKAIEKLGAVEFSLDDVEPIAKYAASVLASGGLDISPLKDLMGRLLDENRVRGSRILFGMVTVSLSDFKPQELFVDEIPGGQLMDYLLASANLPVFKLNRLNGKLYIDGGFYDNLPINLMAGRGVRDIVAVELGSLGVRQPVKRDDLRITWVTPSENIGRILEFNPDKIRRNMKLGYFDTLRAFRRYGGIGYYLEDPPEKGWAMGRFLKLSAEDTAGIQRWMGMEEMDCRRFLFEVLLPTVGTLLDAPPSEDYDLLLLRLYEAMARAEGVERLQIMKAESLISQVTRTALQAEAEAPGAIVEAVAKRLRQSPVYLKARKEAFLPWAFACLVKGFESE